MIGIPIFAGFSAKLMFGQAVVLGGVKWKTLVVLAALGISSVLNAIYFIRTLIRIYTVPAGKALAPSRVSEDTSLCYRVPMLVLTAGNLFLGLFSWVVVDWIERGLMMFA